MPEVGPPFWSDRPVAIVGNGVSSAGFDYNRLRGLYVLAVKGTMFDIPWADAGFGLDATRYLEWRARLGSIGFPVYWATTNKGNLDSDCPASVCLLDRIDKVEADLSDNPAAVQSGGSSGFGALNVAWLKRAKQIVLIGYDYSGTLHVGEQHYAEKRADAGSNWKVWARSFDRVAGRLIKAGVEVINASPNSAITAFPRMTIDEALQHLGRVRSA